MAYAAVNGDLQGLDETFKKVLDSRPNSAKDLTVPPSINTNSKTKSESETSRTTENVVADETSRTTENVVEDATAILDCLLLFRDRYFESHSLRLAARKKEDVSKEEAEALKVAIEAAGGVLEIE